MIKDNFNENIALVLSFVILNNYFLISINFPQLLIKINFLFFLITLLIFYFKNFTENIFLKVFFIFIIIISLGIPTSEWDPRSIWLFHAKRIFYDNSIFSVLDNYAKFSHNGYPSLAPAFASSLAVLIGHWNEVFPKLSFSLMFLPPLILSYSFFKETSYLIFLSIVFFIIGKFLFNGWTDGLVSIYFGLSAILMYLINIYNEDIYRKKIVFYLVAFCFFVSLTLIKNEGVVLLLTLFVVTMLMKIRKIILEKNIIGFTFLSFSFIPIILWKIFCYSKGIENDYINSNFLINLSSNMNNFENYKLILYFLLLNEKFLFSLIFFLISFWINWNRQLFNFVLLTIVIYIFVLFFIYLSTPYDFYFQLDSTAARIMKPPSFLIALFALFNLYFYKIRN